MAKVVLNNVNKIYDNGFQAVKDVNIDIEDKEFVVLLGPSGCGKTTILRMIAGLEEVTSGELVIGDRKVNDISPKDRDIAMVFQNYALYPHMTVFNNMAFGLKLRKISKPEIEQRVNEAARILKLELLLNRKPRQLSGGQRQRVALGRALVRNPKVFLFDEPLSNLDAKLRGHMRAELATLHNNLATTMIYVTHDQIEAMTLGDKIIIMKNGIIHQVGTPMDLYDKPSNMFVGGFIGSPPMNLIEVTVNREGNKVILEGDSLRVKLSVEQSKELENYKHEKAHIGIRPENIYVESFKNKDNFLEGMVQVVENLGAESYIYVPRKVVVDVESEESEAFLIVKVARNNDVSVELGKSAVFSFVLDKVHLFDYENEKSLLH